MSVPSPAVPAFGGVMAYGWALDGRLCMVGKLDACGARTTWPLCPRQQSSGAGDSSVDRTVHIPCPPDDVEGRSPVVAVTWFAESAMPDGLSGSVAHCWSARCLVAVELYEACRGYFPVLCAVAMLRLGLSARFAGGRWVWRGMGPGVLPCCFLVVGGALRPC